MEKKLLKNLREFNDWFIEMEDKQDCFMIASDWIAPRKYPCSVLFEVTDEQNNNHKNTCHYHFDIE